MTLPQITLPPIALAGANVTDSYPCERYHAEFDARVPNAFIEFGLAVFDLSDGRRIFVCSELADNTGRSVTNAWPELASWLMENVGASNPGNVMFIEHYWPGSYKSNIREETFDQILIDWKEMRTGWRRIGVDTKVA